jgi:CubicO group peptidase (beta-lactamase class C family)
VPSSDDYARCEQLTARLAEGSITVLRNENMLLPIKNVGTRKIMSIVVGTDKPTSFANMVDNYARCTHYYYDPQCDSLDTLLLEAAKYDMILVSIYAYANPTSKRNYGVSDEILLMLDSLQRQPSKMVVVGFMSPYGYSRLIDVDGIEAVVLAYQNVEQTQMVAANAVFGGIGAGGRIPVSAGVFSAGLGKQTVKTCMPVALPKDVGMDSKALEVIDSIVDYGIEQRAYPGCQVLVAKDGYVVYNKAFGNFTYDTASAPVTQATMYDIASVTKIAATTLAVMKLVDAGKVSLDDCLSTYLPYLKHTNKKKITIREALSHYAQLQAFVPFWKDAVEDEVVDKGLGVCSPEDSLSYMMIADGLYVHKNYRQEIIDKITDTKLLKEKKYVYSDFGFIFLGDLVQTVSGVPLDIFMQKHFYKPMALNSTTFNPLEHGYSKMAIAPTENDRHFRFQQLQGTVHDENAALMGGVAGHAGLFSTASDLAALMQMLLNNGVYEGKRYLTDSIVDIFNTRYYVKGNNRRALGFDKPFISGGSTHVSPQASQSSFGHSGFTGTFVWVDPEYQLIYVFLSNRVYPDTKDNKLSKLNIRTDIQEQIYKALNTK